MSTHSSDKEEKGVGMLQHSTSDVHHEMSKDEQLALPPSSSITPWSMLLGLAICMGGFLFGYDIGVISGCLIFEDFVLRFGGVCEAGKCSLPDNTASLITATLSIGTFVGALAQAPVSDRFGRKPSMMIWSMFFLVGAVIQTSSTTHVGQLYAGRALAGLGVGALSGLCPLFLAETSPKQVRGAMVSCYQLMIILGICIAYGITWASSNLETSASGWRIPVGFQILWGVGLFALLAPLPESPRWLLQRGRDEACRKVMARMRGIQLVQTSQGPRGDRSMEVEFNEMAEGISAEAQAFEGYNFFTSYALCFSRKGQMWRRTGTAMMLQTLQQLNGQNFYYYYGPVFFQKANVQLSPLQIQFIFGIVSFIMTIPALYLVEKLGRRKSLIFGALMEGACSYIVAFVGKHALAPDGQVPNKNQEMAGQAFIAFAVLHLVGFSMFWGPVPWVTCSEMFPQHLRAKSISLASASNWLWNFLLSYFSNKIATQYGPYIMLIFGSVLFFAAIFVYLVLPELKGLSLEQVDEMYEDRSIMPWHSSEWQPTTGEKNRDTLVGLSKLTRRKPAQV